MDHPEAWAHRVAINLANSAFRRRRLMSRFQGRDAVIQDTSPDASSVTRADLLRGLAALPPRQRAAVILRYHAGFTAIEVASLLGVSPGAVRMLTARAREALASEFGPAPSENSTEVRTYD